MSHLLIHSDPRPPLSLPSLSVSLISPLSPSTALSPLFTPIKTQTPVKSCVILSENPNFTKFSLQTLSHFSYLLCLPSTVKILSIMKVTLNRVTVKAGVDLDLENLEKFWSCESFFGSRLDL